MKLNEEVNRRRITILMISTSFLFLITAFLIESPMEVLKGEWKIITSPGILITDFMDLSNIGSAFFNAGITTLMGCGLAWLVKARFNGYLLSAIFTLTGFSFFGKTPFNIIPIFIGVYLYDKFFSHQPLRDLIAPLLFGTTISPVVSLMAFGLGWGLEGIVVGIGIGVICGGLIAAVMGHVFTFHQGYNLYNIGTSAGLIGTVVYMMMRGFGIKIDPVFYWSTEHTSFLSIYTFVFLAFIFLLGILWGANFSNYKKILKSSGRLASDYVEIADLGTTLVNMAIIGLIGLGYVILIGGDVNGPILAGIFTITGFGALGKHPRNILPVMIGVYLICIPKIWSHTDPGPLLAALFCTTLAPLSGRFGFFAGIAAGALHLPMVMHVGGLHGYMNLYNNGFAGGLAMLIIVGFIKGLKPQLLDDGWERKKISKTSVTQ
ncbi:MAG: DUF1576 domain-containing protein [Pelolinea sp.]|nr:DUF1576 domain-containing protein [Pelolinea sp.]